MKRIAPLLAVLALAAAGCGGSSGPGTGGGSAEAQDTAGVTGLGEGGDTDAPGAENDPIYVEAGNICVNLPLEVLAQQYGVEATPDAVAEAVSKDYPDADQALAKRGCLDVLEQGGQLGTTTG